MVAPVICSPCAIDANTARKSGKSLINYFATQPDWRREEKYRYLDDQESIAHIKWQRIEPDAKHAWINAGLDEDFQHFIAIGSKEGKASASLARDVIFALYSRGISTSRDDWLYDFKADSLADKASRLIENYNSEVGRYRRTAKRTDVDNFVDLDGKAIKWTDRLKTALEQGKELSFQPSLVRNSLYRLGLSQSSSCISTTCSRIADTSSIDSFPPRKQKPRISQSL